MTEVILGAMLGLLACMVIGFLIVCGIILVSYHLGWVVLLACVGCVLSGLWASHRA